MFKIIAIVAALFTSDGSTFNAVLSPNGVTFSSVKACEEYLDNIWNRLDLEVSLKRILDQEHLDVKSIKYDCIQEKNS